MSSPFGYNPMRWKCYERGCFNVKKRPKIEIFAECLPGKNAFGDIDASAEINGNFLFLEFKEGEPRALPTGQRIQAVRLTQLSSRIRLVLICANAETMEVSAVATVHRGQISQWEPCTTDQLRDRIRAAAAHVRPTR